MLLPLILSLHLVASPAVTGEPDEILEHVNEAWTGDLDGMIERGFIRVLTVHNPLFFTFDGVDQRGFAVELTRLFEDHLAEEIGRTRSPTVVQLDSQVQGTEMLSLMFSSHTSRLPVAAMFPRQSCVQLRRSPLPQLGME